MSTRQNSGLILAFLLGAMLLITAGCDSAGGDGGAPTVPTGVRLAKTGQTESYYAGDDGELEIGREWPSPRFIDNGDGTISDTLTGLMWEQTPSTDAMNWATAMAYPVSVSTGGYTDWRVPNVNELMSLTHAGEYNAVAYLNANGCDNSMSRDVWWSSTTSVANSDYAADVSVMYGMVHTVDKTEDNRGLICVRGDSSAIAGTGQTVTWTAGDDGDLRRGVDWPDPRFVDNGDGTITDTLTGLMWWQSASVARVKWRSALDMIADDTTGGYTDWRMPNNRELRSLVNYGAVTPETWLETNGFNRIHGSYFWSSTSQPGVVYRAYIASLITGILTYNTKETRANPYIAVRGLF